MHKSIAFLSTNKHTEVIIDSSIHNNFKEIKYLRINLVKEVKDLNNENFSALVYGRNRGRQ